MLSAWGIDPYALKETLKLILQYAFFTISSVLFLLLIIGVFLTLMIKKENKVKKRSALFLSLFSFGMMFFTVMVWIGMYSWIDRFVANAEAPAAIIEISPSDQEIFSMEPPIELQISAENLKKQWERKGKTISEFWWDLNNDGDYETRTQNVVFTQQFRNSGKITIRLQMVFDDGGFEQVSREIRLPDAVYDYFPHDGKIPLEVSFDASKLTLTDDSIIEYSWDFTGNGNFDEITKSAKITHTFHQIGTYDVVLKTLSSTGKVFTYTAVVKAFGGTGVVEKIEPVIDVYPKTSGEAPLALKFQANKSASPYGNIISYVWDFKDGTPPQSSQSVDHVFQKNGKYIVELTVMDADGNSATTTEKIVVSKPIFAPEAIITNSPALLEGVVPFTVQFSGEDSLDKDKDIISYSWDMNGDGKSDVHESNFQHIFRDPGKYEVLLTVLDSQGNESSTFVTVQALQQDFQANIKVNPPSGPVPLTVQFDASASQYALGNIISYEWNFGDGESQQAGAQMRHIYKKVGEYEVKLILHADDGATSIVTKKIFVRSPVVQSCFTSSDHKIYFTGKRDQDVIDFASTCSRGNIIQWKWRFGDGGTSKDRSVAYVFDQPGVYTVTLEVVDIKNTVSSYSDVIEVLEK
ncbi:hypothetical protein COB57_02625 [Candidatus Peregrinibacteria bacterium]|nr:MAG: hypothetical protein COB57_02625 [Candidatus Peregrinibacteria bacterium]